MGYNEDQMARLRDNEPEPLYSNTDIKTNTNKWWQPCENKPFPGKMLYTSFYGYDCLDFCDSKQRH